MKGSMRRAAAWVVSAAVILLCLVYLGVLTTGELHDKYVFGDMGALVVKKPLVTQLVPFESPGGYLLYAVPTRTAGKAVKGDAYEFVQLIALDSLCNNQEVCLWDPDKQIDVRCTELAEVLRDRRVLKPVKNYLRSKCRAR